MWAGCASAYARSGDPARKGLQQKHVQRCQDKRFPCTRKGLPMRAWHNAKTYQGGHTKRLSWPPCMDSKKAKMEGTSYRRNTPRATDDQVESRGAQCMAMQKSRPPSTKQIFCGVPVCRENKTSLWPCDKHQYHVDIFPTSLKNTARW